MNRKKIGIITITCGENMGNRLQNYAVQSIIKKIDNQCICETLVNHKTTIQDKIKFCIKKYILYFKYKNAINRKKNFGKFNKNIKFSKFTIANDKINYKKIEGYDYFIAGSDQIWNLNYKDNSVVNFLGFCEKNKKIAFAPSFGSENIPENTPQQISVWLNNIPNLSVREDAGKDIIFKLTGRNDVEVLVDPTMLLTSEEWNKLAKKPKILKSDRYILTYFLGELTEEKRKDIGRIAAKYCCEVINLMDRNSEYYQCGPSEFLYLESHAFLVCTDSFHSSVFALLYNRPFVIYDRNQKGLVSMNSRIETLINKFKLKNRKYNGIAITEENLNYDYEYAYKILEDERKKSYAFLEKSIID